MLEKSDLMAIENMFNKFEEKMDQKLDQRFAEFDKKMDEKLDKRFAEHDKAMDKKLANLSGDMDKKLAKLRRDTDKKRVKSEAFLLDEIERNRNILEKRMDKMQMDMDEVKYKVNQIYRITGLEKERAEMEFAELHRKSSELDERVTRLEKCAMA